MIHMILMVVIIVILGPLALCNNNVICNTSFREESNGQNFNRTYRSVIEKNRKIHTNWIDRCNSPPPCIQHPPPPFQQHTPTPHPHTQSKTVYVRSCKDHTK